jgi:hypothetical protein
MYFLILTVSILGIIAATQAVKIVKLSKTLFNSYAQNGTDNNKINKA